MKTIPYTDIRPSLRAGDVIAFSGQGLVSTVIKVATNSNVSHVGIVLETFTDHRNFNFIQLIESTSLNRPVAHAGVQISRLSTRIMGYTGTIWALPLSGDVRRVFNPPAFMNFLVMQKGKPYDAPQAIASAFDRFFPDTPKDLSKLFCSELVVAGLQAAEVLPMGINPSEQTPTDVVNLPIFKECYHVHGPLQDLT